MTVRRNRRQRPLSPRERRDLQSKRRLAMAIVLIVILVGVTGAAFMLARQWNPALAEADLCLVGKAPPEEVVIVLDATDQWSVLQQTRIRQEFERLQKRVPRHARVTLYALEPDVPGIPEPALQLCNPGSIDDFADFPVIGTAGASVVSNPEVLQRRWREGFVQQMEAAFLKQAEASSSPRSPIVETIRGAGVDVFGGAPEGTRKSLFIFSDLLQHSDLYSHYSDSDWSEADGRRLADLGVAGTMSLDGAEVHLFLLNRRLPGRQPGQSLLNLVAFWDSFFSTQNAAVMKVLRIEG